MPSYWDSLSYVHLFVHLFIHGNALEFLTMLSVCPPLFSLLIFQTMYQKLNNVHIWGLDGNASKQVLKANNTEIFANGDSGMAGTDVALGGPRPVQAGFF